MNEMKQPQNGVKHEFCVKDRRSTTISGVKEMLDFDEQTVHMMTALGELSVDGEGLRVKVLDMERGVVVIEGKIDGIAYLDEHPEERRGFWSRIMK